MASGFISVNGEVLLPENAAISALDRGFLFGDNVFEVLVGFHHKVIDVPRHLHRLRRSAEGLQLEIPWSDAELEFELTSLAERLNEPKQYLRLVITRGNGLSLRIPPGTPPNKVIYCFKAPEESRQLYDEGLSMKRMVLPSTERGAAAKTGNYLRSILALQKAELSGFDDVLWTNAEGEITEATTANIFFVERHGDYVEFVTPPPHSGILLGITRDTLISLMKRAGIPISERIIYADELPRFDEAFVCSTVRGLVPVKRIDNYKLHTTRQSAVFRHLQRLFFTWVEQEIGFRVDWVNGRRV